MNYNKVLKMREKYGTNYDKVCSDCCNYMSVIHTRSGKKHRKCVAYGVSDSRSTDWCGYFVACGLFGKNIKNITGFSPFIQQKKSETIDGQISLI